MGPGPIFRAIPTFRYLKRTDTMPRQINRRQKPAWQKLRKHYPAPPKSRSPKGRKKGPDRKK